MKKILSIVMMLCMSLAFVSCGDNDEKENNAGSDELRGTIWQGQNEQVTSYLTITTILTVRFGQENDVTLNRTINDVESPMKGTYTYKNGKGEMKVTGKISTYNADIEDYEGKDEEFWFKFTISDNVMTLKYNLKDVTLNICDI